MPEPALVVHGGAGAWSAIHHDGIFKEALEAGVQAAARAGWDKLNGTHSNAIDAVYAAVMYMEADPNFNAGRGSCLTSAGCIEMDAVIQDGCTMRTGGVIGIQNVRHPVAVAKDIMDKSPHVLLAGAGAVEFARAHGHDDCPIENLLTEKASHRLQQMPEFEGSRKTEFKPHVAGDESDRSSSGSVSSDDVEMTRATAAAARAAGPTKAVTSRDPFEHDTVGAVALDRHGNVAFATSTGGITAKLPGRVGDSPIVGCGGYADNDCGAISTTGDGESFVKIAAAKHIINRIENGESAQTAIENSLAYMLRRVGGRGGAIGVTRDGEVGVAFNTDGMAWATVHGGHLTYGILPGESSVSEYGINRALI